MIKKSIPTLTIILLLASVPLTQASTRSNIDIDVFNFSDSVSFFDSRANGLQELSVENGASYDEAKDSSQRRGTENWEESQTGFLVLPGIVLGILALALLFDRK